MEPKMTVLFIGKKSRSPSYVPGVTQVFTSVINSIETETEFSKNDF